MQVLWQHTGIQLVTDLDMIIVCQEAYLLAYIKISSKFCPSNLSSLRNVCLHSRRLLVDAEGGKSSFSYRHPDL